MRINQNQLYIIRHVTTGDCISGTQCSTIRLYKWKDARRIVNQIYRRQSYRYNHETRRREMIHPLPPHYYEIVPVRLDPGIPIA
jgi:hypothetical protein